MRPIKFPEANVTFGEGQPEYEPLPAWKDKTPIPDDAVYVRDYGDVVTCWELSPDEIKKVQETGCIWVSLRTFNLPLQPMFLTTEKSEVIGNVYDNQDLVEK